MKSIFSRFTIFYRNLKSKIAFYPSLFALLGLFFAFLMMYLEERGISGYLVDSFPLLVVNNGDTATTILSACITGLISMMVFSFSMVMVLLNQASTNYSPRLLPGLISDYKHQIILGIYLSSILYCIFILFSIQPTGDQYQIPGFSVLLGILATVICIYAFIYFIHTISQSIQITYILDKIYLTAKHRLETIIERDLTPTPSFPNTENWQEYYTSESGYFRDIDRENLLNFCKKHGTRLEILPVRGMFALQGIALFRSEKPLTEGEMKLLLSYFHFSGEELVQNNYVLAFKQIAEIIAKAMSPGINDPGTAINAIDYLTELLRMRMLKSDEAFIVSGDTAYVRERAVNFSELMYNLMASIRTYCKQDILVVQKLVNMLLYLQKQPAKNDIFHTIISEEAGRLLRDASESMSNRDDEYLLEQLAGKLEVAIK